MSFLFSFLMMQGCEGSVLLSPELQDGPNRNSLRGLEAIDEVKRALEQECPGLISCADNIQLATRHAVVQSGGPFYPLALGRRDGFIINGSLSSGELPGVDSMISSIIKIFRRKGFNEMDIVRLIGMPETLDVGLWTLDYN
ncbi:hypothetical protein KP509_15G052700 [Ceratopteris richardii]|uniref:Plant heme peroxidase family profile domain-containing protein n=1 Tax=Ceratopteris richardii TaxID=49495 RepID=A0A8T2T3B4_CERRI|nr:hypothetical protein KP509_15G052700 [Ceratopteris richardii]